MVRQSTVCAHVQTAFNLLCMGLAYLGPCLSLGGGIAGTFRQPPSEATSMLVFIGDVQCTRRMCD